QYYRHSVCPVDRIPLEGAMERLTQLLQSSVLSHVMAQEEVGLNLSGGLDSSLLAMMMKDCYSRRMRSFTICDTDDHPDLTHSRQLAKTINASHEFVHLTFEDYLKEIPGCVLAEEQPSSLSGLPLYVLCKRVGQTLRICVNGEGADELFGGYPEY